MQRPGQERDYYQVLGVDEAATRAEIDRQYKREAARHHPDLGGNEERMKSLNEAYAVLKDQSLRSDYDQSRISASRATTFVPVTTPTAQDVGVLGNCLSALLCLLAGFFLLVLVRLSWIWFLWPLGILAICILGFGVMMARSAMVAVVDSLPATSLWKKHTRLEEVAFWCVIATSAYGLYWLME